MINVDAISPDPDPVGPDAHERLVRRRFWRKVRHTLGRVPFLESAVAGFFCATDPATPARTKAVLLGALAYFILPADTIPDVVAGLGFTDDATVLLAAIQAVRPHLKPEHHARARAILAGTPPEAPEAS